MQISYAVASTPLGKLMLAATEQGVCFIQITEDEKTFLKDIRHKYPNSSIAPVSGKHKKQVADWMTTINGYLKGKNEFPEIPLDVKGTDFQLKVWKLLRKIPSGELRSYKEVAKAAGRPKAVRAIASACARNAVALVIPCHRVVHSDGSISGYRWGIKRKQTLINLEKSIA